MEAGIDDLDTLIQRADAALYAAQAAKAAGRKRAEPWHPHLSRARQPA